MPRAESKQRRPKTGISFNERLMKPTQSSANKAHWHGNVTPEAQSPASRKSVQLSNLVSESIEVPQNLIQRAPSAAQFATYNPERGVNLNPEHVTRRVPQALQQEEQQLREAVKAAAIDLNDVNLKNLAAIAKPHDKILDCAKSILIIFGHGFN